MSQEFDSNLLDLVKQKGFCPCEYMNDFEKFKKELPKKEKLNCWLTGRKINDILSLDWNKFEMKTRKDFHNLYLQCDVSLLAVF